ncbi:MAG: hypothetical protein WD738_00410 [Pirellulales bacterium]
MNGLHALFVTIISMPNGLEQALTETELADVIASLLNLKPPTD